MTKSRNTRTRASGPPNATWKCGKRWKAKPDESQVGTIAVDSRAHANGEWCLDGTQWNPGFRMACPCVTISGIGAPQGLRFSGSAVGFAQVRYRIKASWILPNYS